MPGDIQAVIFDIDGTLIESAAVDDALYRQAVRDLLGDVRLRRDLSEYEDVTDAGILLQVFRDNDLEFEETLAESIRTRFAELTRCHIDANGPFPPRPGARELLARLAGSARIEVAVATGGWRRTAEMKLCAAEFAIDDLPIASADDAVQRTRIMEIALRQTGASAASVTYYGDGTWDRDACRRLGWRFRAVGPDLDGLLSFETEFTSPG